MGTILEKNVISAGGSGIEMKVTLRKPYQFSKWVKEDKKCIPGKRSNIYIYMKFWERTNNLG